MQLLRGDIWWQHPEFHWRTIKAFNYSDLSLCIVILAIMWPIETIGKILWYFVAVILQAHEEVITPGLTAPFLCQVINNSGLRQFHWLLNGTRLENLNLRVDAYKSRNVGVLSFLNVTVEYNDTTIQCIANFTSGEIFCSNIATLLVQGEDNFVAFKHYGKLRGCLIIYYTLADTSLLIYRSPYCCRFFDCHSHITGLELHHLHHLDTSLLSEYI